MIEYVIGVQREAKGEQVMEKKNMSEKWNITEDRYKLGYEYSFCPIHTCLPTAIRFGLKRVQVCLINLRCSSFIAGALSSSSRRLYPSAANDEPSVPVFSIIIVMHNIPGFVLPPATIGQQNWPVSIVDLVCVPLEHN